MKAEVEGLDGFVFGSHFLAEEIVTHILCLEDVETIKTCRLVCKNWNALISNRYFWKKKALVESKHWPNVPLDNTIPWTLYANIYLNEPFERNLIKNPCGKKKLENWSILSEGGDKFTIEQPPSGSEKIPHDANLENDLDDSCFATSFHSCSKEQTIQLSRLGLTPEVMDDYKPCITFTDWYAGRFDCGCVYECQFLLLDKSKKIIEKFEHRTTIKQWQGNTWHKVSHRFTDYSAGVRFVKFYHGGMDTQFWAGHYGVKLTGSSIKINFL